MFALLKVTLEKRIRNLTWLDEPTRAHALHKLANLRGHFFTWPQLWNQTYVDSVLQDVSRHRPLHVALLNYSKS
jgi:predicted metalloendopeptidase